MFIYTYIKFFICIYKMLSAYSIEAVMVGKFHITIIVSKIFMANYEGISEMN